MNGFPILQLKMSPLPPNCPPSPVTAPGGVGGGVLWAGLSLEVEREQSQEVWLIVHSMNFRIEASFAEINFPSEPCPAPLKEGKR